MIAIDVELLTRRFVATSFNDRSKAEWPPHPARLFSALVATLEEDPEVGIDSAAAVDWLGAAGDPEVMASRAETRAVVPVYVPDVGSTLLGRTHRALATVEEARDAVRAAEESGDGAAVVQARKRLEQEARKLRKAAESETADDGEWSAATVARAARLLPGQRGRQPRTFPGVTPEVPVVTFVWPHAEPTDRQRSALDRLLARVTRLGHSSSLVACTVSQHPPDQTDPRQRWIPDDGSSKLLRVVSEGQRSRLQEAFRQHRGVEPRVLPCGFRGYRPTGTHAPISCAESVFATDWMVFREVSSPAARSRLGLRSTRAADVARALRGALMKYAADPPPAVLSGHTPDGTPLEEPHAAFVSLPDVGSPRSSGAILGVALILPRACSPADHNAVLRAVGRWEKSQGDGPLPLRLGRAGVMWIERVSDDEPRATLRAGTWCRPARHWATATPLALDENPGDLGASDTKGQRAIESARSTVRQACERIGLPAPIAVEVSRRSPLDGTASAREFMPFPRREGALRRVCVHAELVFDEPVHGPILLGAGRYQGLGLLRPIHEARA